MDFNPNKKNIIKDPELARIERIKVLEQKKKDVETRLTEERNNYADLDREYERVDDSGVSTNKLGDEMEYVQKIIKKLEQELIVINQELEKENNLNK